MPRKNRNRGGNRRNGSTSSNRRMANLSGNASGAVKDWDIERGCGLINFNFGVSDISNIIPLNLDALSTTIPRFAEFMEAYQLFRFRKIQIRINPFILGASNGTANPDVTFAVAYSPGNPTIAVPQTTAATLSYSSSLLMNGHYSIPQILTLNRSVLLRDAQSKWYRTQPSAAVETWEENQGEILFNVSLSNDTNTQNVFGHMFYELELAGQIAPSNIPMEPPITEHFVKFMSAKLAKMGHLIVPGPKTTLGSLIEAPTVKST